MTDITWQDPPPRAVGPGSSKWLDIGASLRKRPGKWALVAANPGKPGGSHAAYARRRLGHEFEVVQRGPEVYARLVGEASS